MFASGFSSFTMDAFLNWLGPILRWPTLLWIIAMGLIFILVPQIVQLVIDVARDLFGWSPSTRRPGGKSSKRGAGARGSTSSGGFVDGIADSVVSAVRSGAAGSESFWDERDGLHPSIVPDENGPVPLADLVNPSEFIEFVRKS